MRLSTRIINILALLIGGSAFLAAATATAEGEFWNKGEHFQFNGKVVSLGEDGIHDPENDSAIAAKQPPVDAMKNFPRDDAGLTDWVEALRKGHIAPRSDILGEGPTLKGMDLNIEFPDTAAMPKVLFSHKSHTEWLTCKNCHPAIFKQKKGANDIKMDDVLTGQSCGVCHGKVAFPPAKNCMRCHNGGK